MSESKIEAKAPAPASKGQRELAKELCRLTKTATRFPPINGQDSGRLQMARTLIEAARSLIDIGEGDGDMFGPIAECLDGLTDQWGEHGVYSEVAERYRTLQRETMIGNVEVISYVTTDVGSPSSVFLHMQNGDKVTAKITAKTSIGSDGAKAYLLQAIDKDQ